MTTWLDPILHEEDERLHHIFLSAKELRAKAVAFWSDPGRYMRTAEEFLGAAKVPTVADAYAAERQALTAWQDYHSACGMA